MATSMKADTEKTELRLSTQYPRAVEVWYGDEFLGIIFPFMAAMGPGVRICTTYAVQTKSGDRMVDIRTALPNEWYDLRRKEKRWPMTKR
jgi:hypothetical protein